MVPGVAVLLLQTLVGCGMTDDAAGAGSADEPLTTVASALTLTQSFETGWGGFVADHHLLCEPGCGALQWSLVRSTSQAHAGSLIGITGATLMTSGAPARSRRSLGRSVSTSIRGSGGDSRSPTAPRTPSAPGPTPHGGAPKARP